MMNFLDKNKTHIMMITLVMLGFLVGLISASIIQSDTNRYNKIPDVSIGGYTTIQLLLNPLEWKSWKGAYLEVNILDENEQQKGTCWAIYNGEESIDFNRAFKAGERLHIIMINNFNNDQQASSNIVTIPNKEYYLSTKNPLQINITHLLVDLPDTHFESSFMIAEIKGD